MLPGSESHRQSATGECMARGALKICPHKYFVNSTSGEDMSKVVGLQRIKRARSTREHSSIYIYTYIYIYIYIWGWIFGNAQRIQSEHRSDGCLCEKRNRRRLLLKPIMKQFPNLGCAFGMFQISIVVICDCIFRSFSGRMPISCFQQ